jgi:hypothetical protein
MENNNLQLPVPVALFTKNVGMIKGVRKKYINVFVAFFALYLVSTLLGAALVPGRLELSGEFFARSASAYGAPFLSTERCFFALFLLFASLTVFGFPASACVCLFGGVYTGICCRLLIYKNGALDSVALAILFSVQIILDVALSLSPFVGLSVVKGFTLKKLFAYISVFVLYAAFSLATSFFITLVIN